MWLDAIRNMKAKSGLTTSEIALQSGIPEPTLEKLFAGKVKDPKLPTMQRLVRFFGYTLDDLDDPSPETKKAPTQEGERDIDDRKIKAAFLGGLADGLSDEEIDEYWDDARDYIGYKIQQKKNKPD